MFECRQCNAQTVGRLVLQLQTNCTSPRHKLLVVNISSQTCKWCYGDYPDLDKQVIVLYSYSAV